MKIECWFTGRTWEPFVKVGLDHYLRRLRPLMPVKVEELKEVGTGTDAPEKEAKEVLKNLQVGDILILLDEKGEHMDSRSFANYLDKLQMRGGSRIIFLVGGAYGFHESVKSKSHGMLSLSAMTFNHQLVRVLFLEQLYRAATILNNHPYHHD